MRCITLLALVLLTLPGAIAQEVRNLPPAPNDFAWQWPLQTEGDDDLYHLSLKQEVYGHLWRDDVKDVQVFNGADQPVPMAPMDELISRMGGSVSRVPVSVPMFRMPGTAAGNPAERLRLVVSQRTDGRLERIDADVASESGDAGVSNELLLDLSGVSAPVRGLLVDFAPGAAPLVARVDVFGSRDLSRWTRLAASQALVALNEGGMRLERQRIEFADTTLPYLRIQRTDSSAGLPVSQVRVLRTQRSEVPDVVLQHVSLEGQADRKSPAYLYESVGPFPVEQLSVRLADRNAVATVIIESRSSPNLPWRERARSAVFRLNTKNGVIESAPLDISPLRDREWRIRTDPQQAAAPTLELGYRPDQFVFLSQGDGPYRLAAGSARNQRGNFPLQAVFQQLTSDADAPIAEASLGTGTELAGNKALAPRPDASGSPSAWQWLLWVLLLIGAFTVISMVMKLLRQSGA